MDIYIYIYIQPLKPEIGDEISYDTIHHLIKRYISTNIGQTFLNTIDDEFPAGHPLHKIFNRNTVKISYSCMPNIKQTIDGHNKTKLSQTATTSEESTCSCRKKEECPNKPNVQKMFGRVLCISSYSLY
jgi:hypothetical protein